ncbi:DUF2798 domain-containing protein [Phreatobacter stygius]|uniref:DUF2798 domain-containing protein n=1 Tax=Phreatobacter stygius TaxID=1940610 RepID=A0A4D7BD24_9HYPH|nr:DUF2798 domain-containing protein [Phreatobacter stygius]QCI65837.1 DUF2798 domain-containing protein [Phreatobacter stygius]
MTSVPNSAGWKLPARYAAVAMPLILSVFMSAVVSAIATLKSIGLVEGIAWIWLRAWSVSWLVAFPTLIVALPVVRRIVAAIVQPPASGRR